MRSAAARRRRIPLAVAPVLVVAIVLAAALAPVARAQPVSPLPIGVGDRFVAAVTAPSLPAGASGAIVVTMTDPLNVTISSLELTLNVYAFNGFPGNDTATGALATPPLLPTPTTSGAWANFSLGSLGPSATVAASASVVTSAATPIGAYAVRLGLSFATPNASRYILLSRGWFSAAQWAAATTGPNGTTVLTARSLALLNVSGILPETSVQVTSTAWTIALYAIFAGAVGLAGVGAFVYYRRTGRKSRSGAR